jgi:uncharacterized protein YidB (DUF937 family)
MASASRLSELLDDPEVRLLVFALAHAEPAAPAVEAGPGRLREALMHLSQTTEPGQYQSWLADDQPNKPLTAEQIRTAYSDDVLDRVAQYAGSSRDDVARQLAAALPDLVDAVSPGGQLMAADELGRQLAGTAAEDEHTAGPFGPHVH